MYMFTEKGESQRRVRIRERQGEVRRGALEVVDDPADGLDVGVLGLPLVMAAVVSTLHDVHAAAEVWLLVHHPAGGERSANQRSAKINHQLSADSES